jgi:hypothetical protein
MSNSRRGSGTRRRPDSYYFDQLPAQLRFALAHAAFEYDAKYFLDGWNRGRLSIPDLIQIIKNEDRKRVCEDIAYRAPGNFGWKKHKTAYADKATRVPILYPEGM